MSLPRMRTQSECMKQLREDDPGTNFTAHALRQGVIAGFIPHVRCGRRVLVNYDGLLEYLSSPQPQQETEPIPGCIRRLK